MENKKQEQIHIDQGKRYSETYISFVLIGHPLHSPTYVSVRFFDDPPAPLLRRYVLYRCFHRGPVFSDLFILNTLAIIGYVRGPHSIKLPLSDERAFKSKGFAESLN